jgi:hypothetical protein
VRTLVRITYTLLIATILAVGLIADALITF